MEFVGTIELTGKFKLKEFPVKQVSKSAVITAGTEPKPVNKCVSLRISDVDKADIISNAKLGKNANDIRAMKRFSKYTRQQIAAIIAWVTMKKY